MRNTGVLAKLLAYYMIALHISGTIKKMHFAHKNSRVVFLQNFSLSWLCLHNLFWF